MEFQEITKENISTTTGLAISDLLKKRPIVNARLKKLKKQNQSTGIDLLVRGNPQLTMGRVTTTEDVDAYFKKKETQEGQE